MPLPSILLLILIAKSREAISFRKSLVALTFYEIKFPNNSIQIGLD